MNHIKFNKYIFLVDVLGVRKEFSSIIKAFTILGALHRLHDEYIGKALVVIVSNMYIYIDGEFRFVENMAAILGKQRFGRETGPVNDSYIIERMNSYLLAMGQSSIIDIARRNMEIGLNGGIDFKDVIHKHAKRTARLKRRYRKIKREQKRRA